MIETGAYGERMAGYFAPDRAANPRDTRLRQIRISCNQTPRSEWIHRSDQPYSVGKGIFNPPASSRKPGWPPVALWQIGTHRETTFGRSDDPRSLTRPNCVLSQSY